MSAQKAITFVVPCYNSARYMDTCIGSLVELNSADDDIEIIIVDDGSQEDNTLEKALCWERQHPTTIRAIHQENRGHGGAVNTGLENARGLYFKVVDSDDWLDEQGAAPVMKYLREQAKRARDGLQTTDMVVSNYVYNNVVKQRKTVISYAANFPQNREFTWNDMKPFIMGKYLFMHSLIYRTQLLRDINLELPEHAFYVDTLLVCCPLPYVESIYYVNSNMYLYYIGRPDQSVNESVIVSRIDQVLLVAKILIQAIDFEKAKMTPKLEKYLFHHLAQVMSVCTVILRMIGTKEADAQRKDIWNFLKAYNRRAHNAAFRSPLCHGTSVPTRFGRAFCLWSYRWAKRIVPFT